MNYKNNLYKRSLKFNSCSINKKNIGFQSSNIDLAIEYFKEIIKGEYPIVLGFTSNAITCGIREYLKEFIKKYNVVSIVTTAGGIEEDFIKSTYDFKLVNNFNDANLRRKGHNRSANIIAENDGYIHLEKKLTQLLHDTYYTPSNITNILGKSSDGYLNEAANKDIKVHCPAIIDGAIGDFIYFTKPNIILDTVPDHIYFMNHMCNLKNACVILLGSGLPKHYIANAFIPVEGCKYWIHFTTDFDWDGCNSGANPTELISWGKLSVHGKHVKILCDFSISFPIFMNKI